MKESRYQEQVQRCSADLREFFPKLAKRHTPLILIAALTEHVGGALFLSQEVRVCTPEKARAVIARVKQLAFEKP
jgi:hypothetical protein